MQKVRSLSIRIEDDMRRKMQFVAKYQAHSANNHILYLIRKDIEAYEDKHGTIKFEELESMK